MGSSGDSGGSATTRKRVLSTLTAALAAAALSALAFGGCGDDEPTVPAGAIAVIEHVPPGRGEITRAELEHQIELNDKGTQIELGALTEGKPGNTEHEFLKSAAIQKLLTRRWIEGEAEELGITVSDREVADEIRSHEVTNKLRHLGKPYGPDTYFATKADLEEVIRENALKKKIQLKTKYFPVESQPEFIHRWSARTYCAPKFMGSYCANSPTAED